MAANDSTALRTSPTIDRRAGASALRKSFDPTRIFIHRDRLPWVWFGIAVAILLFSALERRNLLALLGKRERVVIIDPSHTYYVSPLLAFEEAKDLHAE